MRKSHHIVLLLVFIVLCFIGSSGQVKSSASPDPQADLVLINGKVITVDAKDSIAQAIAVKGDKIVKVGTTAQINTLIGPGTRVIDLRGKTVTPGIDKNTPNPYGGKIVKDSSTGEPTGVLLHYPAVKLINKGEVG